MHREVVDRRTFARQLAATSLAASPLALGAAAARADEAESPKQDSTEKAAPPAELTLQLLRRLYPHEFDESQLAELRRQIEEDQARSRILSRFALTNADEPAPIFAAWRAED